MASDTDFEHRRSGKSFWRRAKAAFTDDANQDLEKQCSSSQREGMESTRFSGDNPNFHRRLEAFTSSLSQFGGSLGNAIEEGFTIVESKASSLLSLDRFSRTQTDKKHRHAGSGLPSYTEAGEELLYSVQDIMQLKASRDVALVIGNRAKQEVKIVKAELEGLRERCSQLEEENKNLKELVESGVVTHEEDELVRMQLEALHLEKTRLANENEKYTREIRFLRELMEYHQLTLEDEDVDSYMSQDVEK